MYIHCLGQEHPKKLKTLCGDKKTSYIRRSK